MITRENDRYRELELQLGSLRYRGISIGSHGTCHQFPDLKLMFDVGVSSLSSTLIPNVLITHAHEDHIGALWKHHHRREEWSLPPADYYMQHGLSDQVCQSLRIWSAMQNTTFDPSVVQSVRWGRFALRNIKGKRRLYVDPFTTVHRMVCTGYSVVEERYRLKEEFCGSTKKALLLAKAAGLEISEPYFARLVSFAGDTSVDVYHLPKAKESLCTTEVLLLKCSFIDDQVKPQEAKDTGHVHIDDLVTLAKNGQFDQNKHILLTHFSARYTTAEIRRIVESRLRDELPTELVNKIQLLVP